MEQPTCKTCKWWGAGSKPPTTWRQCLNHKLNTDDDAIYEDKPYRGSDFLDGSGGEYRITTGPDFGCIHHEPTDTTKGI